MLDSESKQKYPPGLSMVANCTEIYCQSNLPANTVLFTCMRLRVSVDLGCERDLYYISITYCLVFKKT